MSHSEMIMEAPAGTEVPQELLKEMLWVFRVEDASPWNYSIFVLASVVIAISIFLLVRSIRANRNQKMMPREKQTPEVPCLDEAETKDNNSQNLVTETLLSVKPNLAQMETELKESKVSGILFPDPEESET
ncbi:organic solute transporter subunit beta [Talpa occidentalis]|uniref:organic solute transporter subunit beta n=1 Tax=Talpa occidentalis TaxID=50954 RepID=UPI0018900CC8|nr:organic solute transporter subunit beta [Talpa occidentalis]